MKNDYKDGKVLQNFNGYFWKFDGRKKPYRVKRTLRMLGKTDILAEAKTKEDLIKICNEKIEELEIKPMFVDDVLESSFWREVREACKVCKE